MKQFRKLMALLMATMLLVVACTAPGSSAKESADTVNVVFQNLEAKTTTVSSGSVDPILVADVYFQYKAENVSVKDVNGRVIGAATDWTDFTGKGLDKVLKLSRGVWNISLRGFASEEARTAAGTQETVNTKAIFDGKAENVNVGNTSTALTAEVDVELVFTNSTGTGSCSVTVNYTAEYAAVQNKKAKVTLQSGDSYNESVTLTFGENGAESSGVANFTNIPNGIATITVDYLDTANGDVPFEDSGSATTLIMTDMHTSASATISMDVVKVQVSGTAPAETPSTSTGSGS